MRKACCCGQPFREVRASRKIPRATWTWRDDVSWVLPCFCSFLGRKTSVQVIDGDRIWFFKAELLNLQLFHCKPFKPSDLRWGKEGLGGGQVSCDTSLHYVSVRVYLMVIYAIWWLLMPACMHYVSILPLLAWWHFAITTLDFATEPKWEVHGLVRKTKPCFGVTGHRMCQSITERTSSWKHFLKYKVPRS